MYRSLRKFGSEKSARNWTVPVDPASGASKPVRCAAAITSSYHEPIGELRLVMKITSRMSGVNAACSW